MASDISFSNYDAATVSILPLMDITTTNFSVLVFTSIIFLRIR